MAELTKAEKKWVARVQRALDACPSDDIGFYTIGDPQINLYRMPEGDFADVDYSDFCIAVDDADALLGEINFPNNVASTAG